MNFMRRVRIDRDTSSVGNNTRSEKDSTTGPRQRDERLLSVRHDGWGIPNGW